MGHRVADDAGEVFLEVPAHVVEQPVHLGCELHITNSRIVATGAGVVVRDATVHITNSEIEGARASFDAGPGAKVFLQGATLKGTTRRDERAEVQEQGDNRWQ